MSLHHFVQRLSIERTHIPPIVIDSELSLAAYRYRQQAKMSQIGLSGEKRYQIVAARLQKKRQAQRDYYARNAEKLRARAREIYRNSPATRARRRFYAKRWKDKNKSKAREAIAQWRSINKEKVKAYNHAYYQKIKQTLTAEEFKEWQREKNRKAKERAIARMGIEAYRAKENERVKKYKSATPERMEKDRARNREYQRLKRAAKKQLEQQETHGC